MTKHVVTIQTPTGKTRTTDADTLREAGQSVAFTLHYNTTMSKRDATKIAMQAEKTGHAEAEGYTFTIQDY